MVSRILYILIAASFILLAGCGNSSSGDKTAPVDSAQTGQPGSPGEAYTNDTYNVSLRVPDDWILIEEPNLKPAMGTFAINLFRRGTGAAKEAPLHVRANAKHTYVAIWPHGYGTELPAGQKVSFNEAEDTPELPFAVNRETSKILQLKDGTPWAYFIQPKNLAGNWEKHGFIFAQIATSNNATICYEEETGKKIPMDTCDYLAGDRFVRQADLNKEDAKTISQVLESISLDSVKQKTKTSDLINIEKPLPNMDITSPLTVKGRARGQWFFEGSFRVELVDADDNILAETQAKSQANWMTEEFVPFSATLKFDAPDDERGQLIFHRANPSGLPENAMEWSQPVIFPSK